MIGVTLAGQGGNVSGSHATGPGLAGATTPGTPSSDTADALAIKIA